VSGETIDFEGEGLLEGLEGEPRQERLALLEKLAGEGVTLGELRRNTAQGTVMFLPADRVLAGGRRYTEAEVAELSGVETEFLEAARRSMGLPVPEADEAVFSEVEVGAAKRILIARKAGIPDEDILALLRVLGRGLGQAADELRLLPLKLVLEPGISESELATRYGAAVEALYPLLEPMVGSLLSLHLRHATQGELINAMERTGGTLPGSRPVAIAFADLVGFTRLGEEVPPEELGQLAVRLEALAQEAAAPPVRLVKTVGDAAMLASPEPEPLVAATLTLLDMVEAEGEDLPQLRAGAAYGAALPRAGDWFGRPVNLASRITAVARPGSLLAEPAVRASASQEAYRWSFAGQRRLKGIREPVALYRVRRGGPS
jgi:adenylate cyclase